MKEYYFRSIAVKEEQIGYQPTSAWLKVEYQWTTGKIKLKNRKKISMQI